MRNSRLPDKLSVESFVGMRAGQTNRLADLFAFDKLDQQVDKLVLLALDHAGSLLKHQNLVLLVLINFV